MNAPDARNPHGRPPGEPPPPHEGVVETLREEVQELHDRVEDAVGHALPRRVRWTAGRIAWLVVFSLFGLVVAVVVGGALLWFTRHTDYLTVVVNRILTDHSDLVLDVRDVRGNPFRSLRLVEPRLRMRGTSGPPLLAARSMKLAYAPWDLAFGRRRALEIQLDQPVVRLERGPDGKLRLPRWRPGTPSRGPEREYDVRLALRGGEVHLPDSSQDVRGWDLDARILTGPREQYDLNRMRWSQGPWGSRLEELQGRCTVGDSVKVELRKLRTADLELSATGGWRPRAAARFATVDLKRVRWKWLARVFANGLFDVTGEGGGRFDLRLERGLVGFGQAQAVWDSVPLEVRATFQWDKGRLTVSPLEGTSPAGIFTGRVTYTAQDFDLRGHVAHGDPVFWHAIGLAGWPAGDVSGELHYWSWRRLPAGSRVEADLGGSVLAGWRADSARVTVNAPSRAPGSFAVTMFRRGGRVDLQADLDQGAWQGTWEASRFPLDEWPDGRASGIHGLLGEGRGTMENRGGVLSVTGMLGGDPVDWLGVRAASWRLVDVEGALLPKPDLDLHDVMLRDAFFLGVRFDSVRAEVQVGDGQARLERVIAFAGDTVVTARGTNTWGKPGWTAALEQAEARSGQFHWVSEGPLELSGDGRGVTFQRFAVRDSVSRIEVTGRWAVPGGSYDWTGTATGLDLHRLGMPLDWDLSGTADAVLTVTGPSGDPHWTFQAQGVTPGVRGHRGDALRVSLAGARSQLTVRDIVYELGGGSVAGRLEFDGTRQSWPAALTGEEVRRWLATAASWSGRISVRAFPLDRLGRLFPAARGLSGRLGGALDLSGTPDAPQVDVQAEAAPVAWDSLAADRATLRAGYRGQRLEVADFRLLQGSGVSTASGFMPLQLALGTAPSLPAAPMSWRLDVQNGDLAILPKLVPQIAGARGRLDLQATVAGTPQRPTLNGAAHARDGQLLITGRSELIEDLTADFRLNETRITMDSLFARSGKRGTVRASGVMDLSGARIGPYAFDLAMSDFTSVEPGIWAAEFDAPRLKVTDGPRVKGQVLPHVEGDVFLGGARVLFDFAKQSETQQLATTTQPLFCTYRIHLLANNNLRWQPPNGDVEFSADLTAEQTEKSLNVFGDLNAIRGTYDFLDNRFRVDKADLTFDNVGGVNPTLDIEATTRVVPVAATERGLGLGSGPAPGASPHTIFVTISGRANSPTILFSSEPADWDQPTILSQLTVAHYFPGNRFSAMQLSDPLDSYVTRMINAQLSPALSRTFLRDVGQWRLERQQGGLFAGQGDLFVTVTHQFDPRVQLSYTQRLPGFERPGAPAGLGSTTGSTNAAEPGGLLERNVGAEYRINRFFYITTEVSQRRAQSVTTLPTLVPEFNVNLKARWEY
jgi:hypothetical protein